MELTRGQTAGVSFVVPNGLTSAVFKVYANGYQVGSDAFATVGNGVATVSLPWEAVRSEGEVQVMLTYTYENKQYEDRKTINVTKPYLEIHEVMAMLETTDVKAAVEAEAAARFIINAHCGQDFGKTTTTYAANGSGTNTLALPARLISVTHINDVPTDDNFEITGDGFYLTFHSAGVPPVKADYWGLHMHVGGVIHNPNNVSLNVFRPGAYRIKGTWGYEEVPGAIREAARLLVGMNADQDAEYRDRYLTSMTAADWRIQFNDGAFVQTGHVRADQLLAPYVLRRGWAVL